MQRDQPEMLPAQVGRLGPYRVDQFVGLAPRAGFALWRRLAEVEREQGGAHAGERDLLDRVVVPLADAQPRVAVAAAVGGVVEQGGRFARAEAHARAAQREIRRELGLTEHPVATAADCSFGVLLALPLARP